MKSRQKGRNKMERKVTLKTVADQLSLTPLNWEQIGNELSNNRQEIGRTTST